MSRWNPTEEEVKQYRQERELASAHARTQGLVDENRRLLAERDRLRAEIAALREARDAATQPRREPERP